MGESSEFLIKEKMNESPMPATVKITTGYRELDIARRKNARFAGRSARRRMR